MDPTLLMWAPYLVAAVVLMAFKPGRWLLKTLLVTIPLAIVALMFISEPDLRG